MNTYRRALTEDDFDAWATVAEDSLRAACMLIEDAERVLAEIGHLHSKLTTPTRRTQEDSFWVQSRSEGGKD